MSAVVQLFPRTEVIYAAVKRLSKMSDGVSHNKDTFRTGLAFCEAAREYAHTGRAHELEVAERDCMQAWMEAAVGGK